MRCLARFVIFAGNFRAIKSSFVTTTFNGKSMFEPFEFLMCLGGRLLCMNEKSNQISCFLNPSSFHLRKQIQHNKKKTEVNWSKYFLIKTSLFNFVFLYFLCRVFYIQEDDAALRICLEQRVSIFHSMKLFRAKKENKFISSLQLNFCRI